MAGEAYSKRYGVGGFVDLPTQTTSIDSQFLNGVEAALARLLGADPTDKAVHVWDAALGRFKTILLTAANLDPAAAILKSQLAPLAITDADIAAGANISASKLGGNIPVSKIANLNATTRQILSGSGTYTLPVGCRAILVECIGGGGAGGGCPATSAGSCSAGGGGGGGDYASTLIQGPAATYAYSVGAGGAGVSNAGGGNGGDSTFGGAIVVAKGANGGGQAAQQAPVNWLAGPGGSVGTAGGGVGQVYKQGEVGSFGMALATTLSLGGAGGMAAMGGSGQSQRPTAAAGGGGSGYLPGGGGAGAANASNQGALGTGGGGGAGLIVVTEYY